jgi:hypothetical protein
LLRDTRRLPEDFSDAATPKRLATNFACPAESLPSSLLTCPFLIYRAIGILTGLPDLDIGLVYAI